MVYDCFVFFFQLKERYTEREVENALKHNELVFGSFVGCPCNTSLLWQHRDTLQDEFVIDDDVTDKADQRKEKLIKKYFQQNKNSSKRFPIMVGVHVRRTDYTSLLSKYRVGNLLPKEYYFKAFDYFRKRLSTCNSMCAELLHRVD